MLRGLGASEGWTDTFVSAGAHDDVDLVGPAVRVTNPLDAEKPYLRRSLLPGLLGALAYNAGRRQGDVRLFEVGVVFSHPGAVQGARGGAERRRRQRAGRAAGGARDPVRRLRRTRTTMPVRPWCRGTSWRTPSGSSGCDWSRPMTARLPLPGLHPTRSAHLMARAGSLRRGHDRRRGGDRPRGGGAFDLTRTSGGGTAPRRVGWLEVDLGVLFDEERVPRRITVGGAVSRFPSSDIDLAFVVRTPIRPMPWPKRCGPPAASCWSPCTSSTSTGARASTRVRAAWPTGCASAPTTAR